MSFTKMEDREVKEVLSGGWYQWEGADKGKGAGGECSGNVMYSCVKMDKRDLLKLL
jgi:hypothetical protein